MERKIGEIFQHGDTWLQFAKGNGQGMTKRA